MANRGGRTRGVRQRKHWHGFGNIDAALNANGTFILGSFTSGQRDPYTVLRILGGLVVAPAAVGIADADKVNLFFGIGVVSTDAFTAGAASMPDPGAEVDFDWLWWASVGLLIPNTAEYGGPAASVRIDVASKAMRKVGPGQTVALLAEYQDSVGTPPVDILGGLRMLIGE